MSKIFKIKIKPKSGLLTELQSDILFGHFCWRYAEVKGESALLDFLNLYVSNKPVFTISNAFYSKNDEVYFPKPMLPIDIQHEDKNKKGKIIDFLKHKSEKKAKLITFKELLCTLDGDTNEERLNKEEENIEFAEQDLRVSVEISRETFSSKQGKLFSYDPIYLKEDIYFSIFVKVINEKLYNELEAEKIFKEVFEIGIGKKKSSGYGEFDINKFSYEEFTGFKESDKTNAFITLSNYLPSQDDGIEESYYEYHVKYGKLGEDFAVSENPFKRPIIFIKPGSVFKTNIKKDYYGRCTKYSEVSTIDTVVQNGIAFTLNFYSSVL